jgi:hypothetical protein
VYSLAVTDVRQRTIMHTFNGHHSRVRSMAVDDKDGALMTGSVDGDLKVNIPRDFMSCITKG